MRRAETERLVRDGRDRDDQQEPNHKVDQQVHSRQEREDRDRDDDDKQQERGAAAWVGRRILLDARGNEWIAVLERMDGHVLGAVIREYSKTVRLEGDRDEVADEKIKLDMVLGTVVGMLV